MTEMMTKTLLRRKDERIAALEAEVEICRTGQCGRNEYKGERDTARRELDEAKAVISDTRSIAELNVDLTARIAALKAEVERLKKLVDIKLDWVPPSVEQERDTARSRLAEADGLLRRWKIHSHLGDDGKVTKPLYTDTAAHLNPTPTRSEP